MGLLRDAGKVYEPSQEVNVGADSEEIYMQANVKGALFLTVKFHIRALCGD